MNSWKFIFKLLIFFIVATFTFGIDNDKFSVCGPTTTPKDSSSGLVFVTTLDGKISALDLSNSGEIKWTIDFDDGPLISSSIHRRELNNDGQWVRLIPSLNGGLYKFNGENIEAMPVTTDQLLRSSYRYSDDLVFSGGKETRSYGISSKTGNIVYQCNINGCINKTNSDSYIEQDDILVVKRYQQTVRAIEPLSGQERWNYSVGQHELLLISQENNGCNDNTPKNIIHNDIELKAIIPDGIIWASEKNNPTLRLWTHKFKSPIVSIWRENLLVNDNSANKLRQINLFDSSQWSWGTDFSVSPGIYIGMHDRQLYVQENINNDKSLELPPKPRNIYPWQPFSAMKNAILYNDNNNEKLLEDNSDINAVLEINYESQATALSVLYNSEYINGNGFYLFNKHEAENLYKCNHTDSSIHNADNESIEIHDIDDDEENIGLSMKIMMTSFWYWWREVIIISITTAFILNYFITQRLLNATTNTNNAVLTPIIVERHIQMDTVDDKTTKISIADNVDDFKSRYLSDFTPINCLGKGGYGVVFEAKNNIDDCNYAIKRIGLPNSKDSRERVMREVKALAKLDHHNIVRYFHAWLECPPAGWQEQHDQIYINKQLLPPSQCPTTTATTTTTTDNNTRNTKDNGNAVCIDVSSSDRSSVDSAIEAVELNHINDDNSSFIVFNDSNSDGSVITEEYDDNLSSMNDTSMSSKNGNDHLNNDENNSLSIVFKNNSSSNNSIKFKDSIEENPSDNLLSSSLSSHTNERRKLLNKKSPKMFLYIQMQLCQRLSLREWLKREKIRDYLRIINIFQQIVDAVEYVHLQGLIHRDLKPSNVFFAYDDKVKIGDFGLVTAIPEGCNGHKPFTSDEVNSYINDSNLKISKNCNHTACVGTKLYMSPEQMNEQVYDYKVDIYSLGIILFELLMPFNTEMERIVALMDLRKSKFPQDFGDNYPNEFNLLKMMLDDDPSKRPTTLGIKAQPPLSNHSNIDKLAIHDEKYYYELPKISRNPSINGISNSGSGSSPWEYKNLT